jgi:hypothetical protein
MPDNAGGKGNEGGKVDQPAQTDKVARPTSEKRGGYTGGQPKASVKPPVKVPSQSMKPSSAQAKDAQGSK